MDVGKSKILIILLHVLCIGLQFIAFMMCLDLMIKVLTDFNIMDLNVVSFLFVMFFIIVSVIGMIVVLYLFVKELKDVYRCIIKLKDDQSTLN